MESLRRYVFTSLPEQMVGFTAFFSSEQRNPTFNNPFSGSTRCLPEQFNNALIGIRSYFSRPYRIPPSRNTSLAFVASTLLSFLQVMSQGQATSPFQTHPKTINIAITSLLLYGLAFDVDQRLSTVNHTFSVWVNVARLGRVVFGSLLLASLASIFLPRQFQPFLYVFYVFFYAGELQNWLYRRIVVELRETRNGRLTSSI